MIMIRFGLKILNLNPSFVTTDASVPISQRKPVVRGPGVRRLCYLILITVEVIGP